jgi:AraC-like DNA-binding protein
LAIDRVIEYIRSTRDSTSELAQLCRIASVSEPKADPAETTLSDIASRLGFLHQGQFASEYRRLFAELPSKTLAR